MNLDQFDGHTPGPWQCILNSPLTHGDVVTSEGEVVARIRGWGWLQKLPDGAVQQDANGRLVAASPELLAEVRRLTTEADALRRERDELAAKLEAIERAEPVAWIEHELVKALQHIESGAMDITVERKAIAHAACSAIAKAVGSGVSGVAGCGRLAGVGGEVMPDTTDWRAEAERLRAERDELSEQAAFT